MDFTFPPAIQVRIGEEQTRIGRSWVSTVSFSFRTPPGRRKPSIYQGFPYLFQEAFGSLPAQPLARLSTACQLLAESIFTFDRVLDVLGADRVERTRWALSQQANQLEAHRILHELFPVDAPFWDLYIGHFIEYTEACYLEHQLSADRPGWRMLDRGFCDQIARGKAAMSRITVDGLAGISGVEEPVRNLYQAIDEFNFAAQMIDDIGDWREDLTDGTASLLLARTAASYPVGTDLPREPGAVLVRMIECGAYREVLELAIDSIETGKRLLDTLPPVLFRGILDGLDARATRLFESLDRVENM